MLDMQFYRGSMDLHSARVANNTKVRLASQDGRYCDMEHIHFLSQRELLQWALNKWCHIIDNRKRATDDDKLCAISIMFADNMCDWIRYMISTNDPNNWLELDTWTGKRNMALHLHHEKILTQKRLLLCQVNG